MRRSAPRRCPSAARRRAPPCRFDRAGSRALARRTAPRAAISSPRSSANAAGRSARRRRRRTLPDMEKIAAAGALALEDDALEDLCPAPASLDHLEVDAHAVARVKGRKSLPDLVHARCCRLRSSLGGGGGRREKTAGANIGAPRGRLNGTCSTPASTARRGRGSARPASGGPAHGLRRPARRAPPGPR